MLRAQRTEEVAVVVSAFQGVTDKLIETAQLAAKGSTDYAKELRKLERRHNDTSTCMPRILTRSICATLPDSVFAPAPVVS